MSDIKEDTCDYECTRCKLKAMNVYISVKYSAVASIIKRCNLCDLAIEVPITEQETDWIYEDDYGTDPDSN